MFADQASKTFIATKAAQICLAVREAFHDVEDFQNWLSAQGDTDLTGLGFTSQDLTFLRSAFADLHDLALKYGGAAGTIAVPYPFSVNAKQVTGPQ